MMLAHDPDDSKVSEDSKDSTELLDSDVSVDSVCDFATRRNKHSHTRQIATLNTVMVLVAGSNSELQEIEVKLCG